MADLVLLIFANGETVRCSDLDDAKAKAIANASDGITVEVTPPGKGGTMTTLEFDQAAQDWRPVSNERD